MMKKLVILGAGESGIGAALLAKKNKYDVFVSDKGIITEKSVLSNNDIRWEEGVHTKQDILSATEVVKSPGIPDSIEIIKDLKSKGIPILSEVEFAFRYTKAKIIAITGTNGKTTTTLLIGHILKRAGYDVLVAGNVGAGFARSIVDRDYDFIVLELSSFQLDGIEKFKADISIILNITPDHLDRYENDFEKYIQSKFRITKNQKSEDIIIYNYDDKNIRNKIETQAKKLPFSLYKTFDEGAFYKDEQINININKFFIITFSYI